LVEPYGSADVAIDIDSKEIVVTYDVQPDHPFRFQLETQGVPTNVSFTDSEPLAERLRAEGFDVDLERRREWWSDITGLFLGVPSSAGRTVVSGGATSPTSSCTAQTTAGFICVLFLTTPNN
jgi:hypothetical protein